MPSTYIYIEIVLVEAVENDLNIALAHYFVNLAVLLAANELLMLVGKLDLGPKCRLRASYEWERVDDGHGSLDGIVAAIDVEIGLFEGDLSTGVDANIRKHDADVGGRGLTLRRIKAGQPPRGTVELAGLQARSV